MAFCAINSCRSSSSRGGHERSRVLPERFTRVAIGAQDSASSRGTNSTPPVAGDPDELLTRPQLVREFGHDKRTIERRLRGIEPAKIEQRGSLLVRYWRRGDVLPRMGDSEPGSDLAEQLERFHKAKADKLEIERAVRAGELVELEVLVAQLADRFMNARATLLGAPARLAPRLAEINATKIGKAAVEARMALLRQVLIEVFTELEAPLLFQREDA